MDFDLTDDQAALAAAVTAWLPSQFTVDRLRHGDAHAMAGFTEAAAKQGWFGVSLPEELGGIAPAMLDLTVVVEALGAGLAPASGAAQLAAAETVRLAGTPDQHARWLTPIAEEGVPAVVGRRRVGGAWTAAGVTVTSASGRLSGDAGHVIGAADPEILVVAARTRGTIAWHVLHTDSPGVHLTPTTAADPTAYAAHLLLEDATAERLAGAEGAELFDDVTDRLALISSADLIGAARAGLAQLIDHLRTREQFGRPIGSFQAVQHELAELHVRICLVGDALRYAAHARDEGFAEASRMTAVVKASASSMSKRLAAALVQYHGAIGFTWEHDAHLYFKRLQRSAHDAGDSGWHLERIAADHLTPTEHPVTTGEDSNHAHRQ